MARSSFLLFKRPSAKSYTGKMYYLKIWLPKERRYTVPKSLSVLAEQLGVDAETWPPSTKAGARHIAEEWEKPPVGGFLRFHLMICLMVKIHLLCGLHMVHQNSVLLGYRKSFRKKLQSTVFV